MVAAIAATLLPWLALAAPVGAAGAPPTYWSDPFPIVSDAQSLGPPVLVRDGAGGVTVLWVDQNVTAKRWTATEGWSAPMRVGASTYPYMLLDAAASGGGDIIAVWPGNASSAVWSAKLSRNGTWSDPVELADAAQGQVVNPHVAGSPDGHAWAVWLETDSPWWPGCECIRAATFSPGGGWGAPRLIANSSFSNSYSPTIASVGGEYAMIAWLAGDGNHSFIRTAEGDSSGDWENGTNAAVASPGGILKPVLHGRGANGALLAWQGFAGSLWSLRARLVSPDLVWGPIVNVSDGNVEGRAAPVFATDDAGTTFLSWPEQNSSTSVSKVRAVAADGTWGTSQTLSSGREANINEATVAAGAGPAVAMWREVDGSSWRYYWSLREPGLGWQDPVAGWSCSYSCPYDGRDYLTLGATATGALAAWVSWSGGNYTLTASALAYQDRMEPALLINEPANGSIVEGPSVVVSGRTEPGATVVVAGVVAAVGGDGTFRVTIALVPGAQALNVTARDPAGNIATRTVLVTYAAPTAPLSTVAVALGSALLVAAVGLAAVIWRASRRVESVREEQEEER